MIEKLKELLQEIQQIQNDRVDLEKLKEDLDTREKLLLKRGGDMTKAPPSTQMDMFELPERWEEKIPEENIPDKSERVLDFSSTEGATCKDVDQIADLPELIKAVKETRFYKKHDQSDAAIDCGLASSTWSRLESGKEGNPRGKTLNALKSYVSKYNPNFYQIPF